MADTSFLPHKAIFSLEDAQENFEALEGKVGALAAAPAAGSIVYGRLAADVTSTTSMASLTGLSFAIAASEVRSFEAVVYTTISVQSTINFQLTGPASPSSVLVLGTSHLFSTGTTNLSAVATAFSSALAFTGMTTVGAYFTLRGTIVNGANAGTVQVQWDDTTGAGDAVAKAGSYLVAIKGA